MLSLETRTKISKSLKGRKMPWVSESNKKRVYSDEVKKNRSELMKGLWANDDFRNKMSQSPSEETRKKLSDSHKGEKAYNWIADRTLKLERERFRLSKEWKIWRDSVFQRDRHTCQECSVVGGNLEPHHIVPIRIDLKNLLNINNGITLCRECHKKTFWKEKDFEEKYLNIIKIKG